jgi:DNA-directed RNA polymerase I, II, and III subunit RPABC3
MLHDNLAHGNSLNDAVSRIQATSHNTNSELTLDIAPELYPLAADETFTLALAKSLIQEELDVNGDEGDDVDAPKKVKRELWRSEDQGLAADYEYVMYGKVSLVSSVSIYHFTRSHTVGEGTRMG